MKNIDKQLQNELTERKRVENELRRLNRELRAISSCNQVLMRAVEEQTLLNKICSIICSEADYRLAWVGYAEHDDAKTVRPVARAGIENGYIATANITWADTERGRGPFGTAIRNGETIYVQDSITDPRMSPWRESALQCGYNSCISLPLKDEDKNAFGVLNICSSELNAFTPDEIRLLEELAGDLAFGINVLRTRTERKITEESLRESELKYRTLVESSIVGVYFIQDNLFRFVNKRFCEIHGYSYEEVVDKLTPMDIAFIDDRELVEENLRKRLSGEVDNIHYSARTVRKDGDVRTIEILGCSIIYNGRRAILGTNIDITERRQIENIMQARLRLLEFANSHSMDELLTATLDEIEIMTGSTIGFYHFLESDQKTLSLQNWSTNTLKNICTANGKGSHYNIGQAGVWVDCVYERRPVIHNDYASLNHRRGMPEGHAPVVREAVVPIFRGNLIKAIIGVGNKSTNYNESDIDIVSQLGDFSWDFTERKRAEEALQQSEQNMSVRNQIASVFLSVPDDQIYGEVLDIVLRVMGSKYGMFGYIDEDGDLVIPSMTRDVWDQCQVPGKDNIFPPEAWGGLWGQSLREKKALFSNGSFRVPEGHIKIDRFLTVPIIYREEAIGLLSVANKEADYEEKDKKLLETITDYISPILNARLQRDKQEKERRQTENALLESETRYRLLAENLTDIIWTTDLNLRFTYVSPSIERIRGYSVEEALKHTLKDILTPASFEVARKSFMEGMEKEKQEKKDLFRVKTLDLEEIRKDGSIIWTESKVNFLRDPGGKVLGVLGVTRDISDRKEAEKKMIGLQEQLRQSQKLEAIGSLAGGIAHDFNNLLTVISGYSQLSLIKLKQGDPLMENMKEITKASDRATDLTRQLLAFSRRQVMEFKVLDINKLIQGMEKMLRRMIGEDITLLIHSIEDMGRIKADPGQIEQVILNLAVNSRDAMPSGGRLILETDNVYIDEEYADSHIGVKPGHYVRLSVSDTGCGIAPDVRDRIFEPFFTTKDKDKGTGLGLSTVYGIVKQSGGNIWVYSEPGKGTTFKVYLPRVDEPFVEMSEKREQEGAPRGTETILVVEDDEVVRKLAVHILRNQGYKLLEASNSGEALLVCEQQKEFIHLILTDVIMPKMSGPDFIKRLKQIRQDFKALYMSGYTDVAVVHHGVQEGEMDFIQKPFTLEGLSRKVREVLDKDTITSV